MALFFRWILRLVVTNCFRVHSLASDTEPPHIRCLFKGTPLETHSSVTNTRHSHLLLTAWLSLNGDIVKSPWILWWVRIYLCSKKKFAPIDINHNHTGCSFCRSGWLCPSWARRCLWHEAKWVPKWALQEGEEGNWTSDFCWDWTSLSNKCPQPSWQQWPLYGQEGTSAWRCRWRADGPLVQQMKSGDEISHGGWAERLWNLCKYIFGHHVWIGSHSKEKLFSSYNSEWVHEDHYIVRLNLQSTELLNLSYCM